MSGQKKMYKVFSPMEKKGGGTYWMRLGTAFTNRDESINLYLDAVPPPNPSSHRYELQIREFTEEDRRRSEAYASGHGNRDLGGAGAGPTSTRESRAVTASAGSANEIPF